MTGAIFVAFLARAIKFATVFIFGSTGETITEKSGHLNMGIPGIMYLGALGGIVGEKIYVTAMDFNAANYSGFMIVFMPILFALLFAGVGGLLFSFFTVTLKCNHNVTGLTITTFGVGLSCYLIGTISSEGISDAGMMLQSLFVPNGFDWNGNWFGEIFLSQSFFTYIAIIVAIVAAIVISRTRVGLNLRACGENPAAADAAGINVDKYRYLATILGAAIAGLGGMALEIDLYKGMFNVADAVDSFGWLALSLVIFSMWKPSICILASFLFGMLKVLPYYIPGLTSQQMQIFSIIPYAATILVLIITSIFNKKNAQPPAGLGITYFREDR